MGVNQIPYKDRGSGTQASWHAKFRVLMNRSAPKARFLTGHLADFRANRIRFLEHCAHEHGDVVPLRLLGFPVWLISRPDVIEQVLVGQAKNFTKSFGARLSRPLLGEGLVTAEGERWKRQRRLCAPAFHPSRIASYATEIVAAVRRELSTWAGGQVRDVHADMMRLAMEIACRTLLGADACPDATVVGRELEIAMTGIVVRAQRTVPLPDWLPTPMNVAFKRAKRNLDAIVTRIIAMRRASKEGERPDLLSTLLAARDEDGLSLSDAQLLDEVRTLFIAGHETTALTLSYSLYLLANDLAAQRRLQEEVDALGGRELEYADLPRLRFTRQVVLEALRLYPPADTVGREAQADCTLVDLFVPRKTNLFMSPWVIHRDARHFREPLAFRPERWTEQFEKSLPRFAFFPFGGGPRTCIGQSFAMAEAILALACLCQRFSFRPGPTFTLELVPVMTVRPKSGVRLHVEARTLRP